MRIINGIKTDNIRLILIKDKKNGDDKTLRLNDKEITEEELKDFISGVHLLFPNIIDNLE